MPIAQILCEGSNNSPDVRILSKLLAGICEIKPLGGKYGMGTKIIARREILGKNSVYGMLDGDFIAVWKKPENKPINWTSNDGYIHFGWRFERKEIENYLIDPLIITKALGDKAPDMVRYKNALESAKETIAFYQAARTALTANRLRFKDIPSAFGTERGKEKHPFPVKLDKENCERELDIIIEQHRKTQTVKIEDVKCSFEFYLSECQSSGCRNQNYLHAFAGKDLFWAMNQWLINNEFIGAWAFREKILTGIQQSTEDIAIWLPEWADLKEKVSRI